MPGTFPVSGLLHLMFALLKNAVFQICMAASFPGLMRLSPFQWDHPLTPFEMAAPLFLAVPVLPFLPCCSSYHLNHLAFIYFAILFVYCLFLFLSSIKRQGLMLVLYFVDSKHLEQCLAVPLNRHLHICWMNCSFISCSLLLCKGYYICSVLVGILVFPMEYSAPRSLSDVFLFLFFMSILSQDW